MAADSGEWSETCESGEEQKEDWGVSGGGVAPPSKWPVEEWRQSRDMGGTMPPEEAEGVGCA